MDKKVYIIRKCEELIRTFNIVTHSIDTHCSEHIGDFKAPDAKPDIIFIHQVIYGWYREKAVLDAFIKNFYIDNAVCVLRSDMIMYTILTYLALFRMEELGFPKFKEFAMTQDPTKVCNFVNYLFNSENLWGCLRAEWMKVRDLTYVEDELIAGVELYLPEINKFCTELDGQANVLAAAEAAKEEAQKNGTVGLGTVTKKGLTRPISPKITRPKAPIIPEPERIDQIVTAHEIPGYLNNTTMASLTQHSQNRREQVRDQTIGKYDPKFVFRLNETKGGRDINDIKREMEEERTKDLHFDSSYVNIPPDFSKIPAKVKINAASILREDYLFRKQQAKDVALIKRYEEELRDPVEYFAWQTDMREKDSVNKLKQVVFRREQAKQSAEEAKAAMFKQKDDNRIVADLLREQTDIITKQKELEVEVEILHNREAAKAIAEVRDTKPRQAVEKTSVARIEETRKFKDELEILRQAKEAEDKIEEDIRADKIRQLRAINTVQKKYIKVFDPTQSSGLGLMNEMSYMEMKERLSANAIREEAVEMVKRAEIVESKEKKSKALEERALNIQRVRRLKADATKTYYEEKRKTEAKAVEDKERVVEEAAVILDVELRKHREEKRREAEDLRLEQERIKRQQQYMGAAMGAVEESRFDQQLQAMEREIGMTQIDRKESRILHKEVRKKDRFNAIVVMQNEIERSNKEKKERSVEIVAEKKLAIERFKDHFIGKKTCVLIGHQQHERTKTVKIEHNPYAARITAEIHQKTLTNKERSQSALIRSGAKALGQSVTFGED